jgi:hypothetical protein
VAYVEKVVSPTEIIVSQDSWGGDFSWARITKDGKGWPNGFVHFRHLVARGRVASCGTWAISARGSPSWKPARG